ncbi:MAG: ubiquinone/menaquinone biosynthesis methyltransferase [Phycisphaerae bacterium]
MVVESVRAGRLRVWDGRSLSRPHAQPDKAWRVRRMFEAIAGRYELVNRLASFGLDAYWRRWAVKLADLKPGERALDVACGTGGLTRALLRAGRGLEVLVGLDFAGPMLQRAAVSSDGAIGWCQADALRLPFSDGSFTLVSCAFGVRNFQELLAGLKEMHRVLRPGGRAVIAEFSLPSGRLIGWVYRLYFERLMPAVAMMLSGDRWGAYRYLVRSVISFVDRDEFCEILRRAGFGRVKVQVLTLGAVVVYVAWKGVDGRGQAAVE